MLEAEHTRRANGKSLRATGTASSGMTGAKLIHSAATSLGSNVARGNT